MAALFQLARQLKVMEDAEDGLDNLHNFGEGTRTRSRLATSLPSRLRHHSASSSRIDILMYLEELECFVGCARGLQ
jgi:hypothetical protein